jgi:hypothetical protein
MNTKINLLRFFSLSFLLIFMGCEKEEQVPTKGQLSFSFDNKTTTGSRTTDTSIPAFASYSLKKTDGSTISDKVELYAFNEDFLTLPQELASGSYSLESFQILDADNAVIYSSPLQDSPLADLVEHPLPLVFTITSEETTDVVPEVLAVANHSPQDFGYATFGFTTVDVAALRMPALPGTEELVKISYKFTNGSQNFESEVEMGNDDYILNLPELLGNSWEASITLWTKKNCADFQKVYRFSETITFYGSIIRLPLIDDSRWKGFYCVSNGNVKVFHSVDPRQVYDVIIELPGTASQGYVDLTPWNEQEHQLCNTQYQEVYGSNIIIRNFQVHQACDLEGLRYIDSYINFKTNTTPSTLAYLFEWEILADGQIKPVCKNSL